MPTDVLQGFILDLPNEPGALHRVTVELARANVNIQGIGASVVHGRGVIGLVAENDLETRHVLEEVAENVRAVQFLTVKTQNAPGALDTVLTLIANAGLNVVSLFPLVTPEPTIAMAFDDAVKAREVLRDL